MVFDSTRFGYGETPEQSGQRVSLPLGLSSEDAVLDALGEVLEFPDYYGRNWNALDECLCNLEWLAAPAITLEHRELPALGDGALHIYLSVLSDAVAFWEHEPEHSFTVLFPQAARATIERLARQP